MLKPLARGQGEARLPFLDAKQPAAENVEGDENRPGPRRRRARLGLVAWSAILVIALPTLTAAIYYLIFAVNQYAVEVRFAVRGSTGQTGSDVLGVVTGVPTAGSATADSYIVMDFIHSREILEKMAGRLDIRAIYGPARGDFYASFDPDETIEELVEYWRSMVSVNYDTTSQVIAVQVRAFAPEDARAVAQAVIALSEDLTNQLSARARLDAVKNAEEEVRRMEDRLRRNRAALRTFREEQQEFDPTKKAEVSLAQIARLEEEIINAKAKRSGLLRFMQESAPSIAVLDSQIRALEQQLAAERAKIGQTERGEDAGALPGLIADYDELAVEREFAEKAYVSALTSLERARFEADQQQRYLATFVPPSLPEEALYPKSTLNCFMILSASAILWALGLLVFYGVRDHAV